MQYKFYRTKQNVRIFQKALEECQVYLRENDWQWQQNSPLLDEEELEALHMVTQNNYEHYTGIKTLLHQLASNHGCDEAAFQTLKKYLIQTPLTFCNQVLGKVRVKENAENRTVIFRQVPVRTLSPLRNEVKFAYDVVPTKENHSLTR